MPHPSPWDDRHRESLASGDYPTAPHPFLLEHADDLPTSGPDRRNTALDIAAGLGRSTFWLATRGLHVTALDVSPVAVDNIAARARAQRLPIDAQALDLATHPLPPGPFDLIVNSMFLLRHLAPQIEDRLAPGGLLLFVTLLENGSGPPVVHKEYLLRRGELATLFPALEPLDLREDPADAARPLACLLARRPHA